MPGLDHLLPFLAAALIFAIIPGPAMLYAAAQTMSNGRSGGLKASIGMHIGGYVHVGAAAFGLSALLAVVPPLYIALKLAGAAYLIWLGFNLMRRQQTSATVEASPLKTLTHSAIVEILNPKSALFYLAFLPQFVEPAASWPIIAQLVFFGVIMNLLAGLADIAVVLAAAIVLKRVRASSPWQRMVRAFGGATLMGLGAHLALSKSN
ncbi:LysE family translocator [Lacibacterium aquatile]|uniref:LysE family translocator n=1 Tax=Lacibacterium aquatile TaxID=1168082 RepID=A0ABW5DVP5_9PROT